MTTVPDSKTRPAEWSHNENEPGNPKTKGTGEGRGQKSKWKEEEEFREGKGPFFRHNITVKLS